MALRKLQIIFFLILAINCINAQNHSQIKFSPPFSKDTLDIRDRDTLRYDVNIFFSNSTFSLKSITGQLKIYNRYDLVFKGPGFSIYNGGSKVLTLADKGGESSGKWDIKTRNNPDIPNFLDFEYRTSPTDKYNGDFSFENLKKFISDLRLGKTTYYLGNKELFFRVNGKLTLFNLQNRYIEALFQKEDIRNVNILNDKGELVFKISYKFLMEIK